MSGSNREIQVLLIEDNPDDADLIQEALQEQNASSVFFISHTDYLQAGIKHLQNSGSDVVLLDLTLPDSRGLVTLTRVLNSAPQIPVVILTGIQDESLAVKSLRLGAQDYLVKGQVNGGLISRIIRYAIERKKTESMLRKTADDLAHANRQLKEVDEAKSRFITIAAHEIKTPLAVTLIYMSLILGEKMGALCGEMKGALEQVKAASEHLVWLVDDLLDLSRIEMGQLKMETVLTDLNDFLKKEILIFKEQAKHHEITIEMNLSSDLQRVYCDRVRMRQVFDNLITNAIKFTPRKGRIQIGARNDGGNVQIDFKDTGIGVRPGDEERVFEPFQHVQKTGLHGEKSSGVGLAVVKKIMEAHGGKVFLKSSEGHGSTFSVILRAACDGKINGSR